MCEFEAHIVQAPKTPGHDAKRKPLGTAQFPRELYIASNHSFSNFAGFLDNAAFNASSTSFVCTAPAFQTAVYRSPGMMVSKDKCRAQPTHRQALYDLYYSPGSSSFPAQQRDSSMTVSPPTS